VHDYIRFPAFDPSFRTMTISEVSEMHRKLIETGLKREVSRRILPAGYTEPDAWEIKEWDYLFRIVGSLTYKPGWAFHLFSFFQIEIPVLRITIYTEDAWHPGQFSSGRFFFPMHPALAEREDLALEYIHECICKVETHETGEWLRVDGEAPFFPHKPETGEAIYHRELYPGWRNRRKKPE